MLVLVHCRIVAFSLCLYYNSCEQYISKPNKSRLYNRLTLDNTVVVCLSLINIRNGATLGSIPLSFCTFHFSNIQAIHTAEYQWTHYIASRCLVQYQSATYEQAI